MSDDIPDMDALFASLESAADEMGSEAAPEAEAVDEVPVWVPPYVVPVELPMDVSISLDELVSAVQTFLEAARGFMGSDHLDVEGIAQQLQPVGSEDDYPATEAQLAEWQATIDGRTRGLTDLMALVDEARTMVRSETDRVSEIFAGAPPPPEPPPPPPPPPDDDAPPADEPAMTPV